MKVLFLTQTPEAGASARYRVYQYAGYLSEAHISYDVSPAVSEDMLTRYNENPNLLNKLCFYLGIIKTRLGNLKKIGTYDIVFLQRDILVYFYPIIEKLIAARAKKLIFDFDDAIYEVPSNKNLSAIGRIFLDRCKIERIIRLSSWVITANPVLSSYAGSYTEKITMIPTSIDLDRYPERPMKKNDNSGLIIGWIGSDFTFSYLKGLWEVFKKLSLDYDFTLTVIGAHSDKPAGFPVVFKDWNLENEVSEIANFDIGIMPLSDDRWSAGKSGTKLSQYGACYVPSVCSPVGINREIIENGVGGFWAETKEQWYEALKKLLEDSSLRADMGLAARKKIEQYYSIQANAPKLIEVLRKLGNNDKSGIKKINQK